MVFFAQRDCVKSCAAIIQAKNAAFKTALQAVLGLNRTQIEEMIRCHAEFCANMQYLSARRRVLFAREALIAPDHESVSRMLVDSAEAHDIAREEARLVTKHVLKMHLRILTLSQLAVLFAISQPYMPHTLALTAFIAAG